MIILENSNMEKIVTLNNEEIAGLELAIFYLREHLENSPDESDKKFSSRLEKIRDKLTRED